MNFFKKFYKDFICVKLSDYAAFDSDLQINKLLFFVSLGLIAACLVISYHNGVATLVLKKLIRIEAFGEENSKTLADLNLGDSRAVKTLLRHKQGAIKSIILTKEAKSLTYEEYTELEKSKKMLRGLDREEKKKKLSEINEKLSPTLDFEKDAFYIPKDKKDAAERFISDKSTTFTMGLVYSGIILISYVALALLMPTLLSWISGIISK